MEAAKKGNLYNRPDLPAAGLTDNEAARRQKEAGKNVIVQEKGRGARHILFAQFKDFLVMLLAFATAASAFMGEYTEAIAITLIIVLNAFLGFIQEYRTEKTLESLKKMAAPDCSVVRNGISKVIPAEDLVPGDLFIIEPGVKIPADARVIEAIGLKTDESLLTGESRAISKREKDTIYMGTSVTSGRGSAVVEKIGMQTEMGDIAAMLNSTYNEDTPLQKNLAQLGKIIGISCVVICMVVAGMGVMRGLNVFDMIVSGISLAVAAVPEGMPAIVAVALAIGVRRMLVINALVRKLPAVETLGCATVICSDKTGTITQNKMTVRRILSAGGVENVDKKTAELSKYGEGLVRNALLCCNAIRVKGYKNPGKMTGGKTGRFTSADHTESAIVNLAYAEGVNVEDVISVNKRVHEIPFDSTAKRMTVVRRNEKGDIRVIMKGALDAVISRCSMIEGPNKKIIFNKILKKNIYSVNEEMANQALRVIAVAYKDIPAGEEFSGRIKNVDYLESDLCFCGLIGMMDPPRKEVKEAVSKCDSAGIRTIMITGDHRTTALAIAKEIGLTDKSNDKALTGAELDRLTEEELYTAVEKVNVFARVSPENKLNIVKMLKKQGHVTAMTGDGVNDAPAIKEADIGVAMGKSGTDVTREAADMVLLDDNFATITKAVEQGRVIYGNIRKFIRYLLACNVGEILVMFIAMVAGYAVPLLPVQILWVNLVTDGLPALALGFDPPEADVMEHKPRKKKEGIFSSGMSFMIISRGVLIGLCTTAVYLYVGYSTANTEMAGTAAFATLIFTQLIHVFECKSERKSLIEFNPFNNLWLVAAAAVSFILTICVIVLPEANAIFKTVPLNETAKQAVTIGTLAVPLVGGVITKLYVELKMKPGGHAVSDL